MSRSPLPRLAGALLATGLATALGAQPRPAGPVEFSGVIRSQRFSKVVDVEGKSRSDGANTMIWKSTGGLNQMWEFVAVGGGAYAIVSRNSGLVLDVDGKSTSDGANVQQYRWNGGANQRWYLREMGGGNVRIVNARSNKCLAIDGNRPDDGVNVVQYSCSAWSGDVWFVTRGAGGGNYGGGYNAGGNYGGGYDGGNNNNNNNGGYVGTPQVTFSGGGGRVNYKGTSCMINYRGNGSRIWTAPACSFEQGRRADEAFRTAKREQGEGDGEGNGPGPNFGGSGDNGQPPRIIAGTNREGEVIFSNNCVVQYDPRGRRRDSNRNCNADQVRRADVAMSSYRREQGW
jgi:hypothetical protein